MGITLFFLLLGHLLVDFFVGIWPIYKTIQGIDLALAATISGIAGFLAESVQVVFGFFSDRGYRKQVMVAGIIMASAILFAPQVNSSIGYFLIVLLLMLGSSAFHPAASGFASSLSKKHKAKTILCFAAGGAIGLGFSALIFTKVFTLLQGQVWLLLIAVMVVVGMILRHPFTRVPPSRAGMSLSMFFAPFQKERKALLLLYFSQIANQGILLSVIFLLPDLLREQGCHSWLCMGGGQLCLILGGALTMVPAGYCSDHFGPKSVMLVVIVMAFLFLYAFLILPHTSLLSSGLLLLGFGAFVGLINPLIVAWGNRIVPESPSVVSAILMGSAWCFAHIATIATGFLTRLFTSNACLISISIMGLLLLANFFLIAMIPRPKEASLAIEI